MTLTEFLEARLAEDEAAAQAALRFRWDLPTDAPWEQARLMADLSVASAHIARHDPARVLREVEAKRVIADVADRWTYGDEREAPDGDLVLRHLAAVYADHPDYREEWRP